MNTVSTIPDLVREALSEQTHFRAQTVVGSAPVRPTTLAGRNLMAMETARARQLRTRSRSADRAFHLARKAFIAGERIDMQDLATQLGVDRTTLFRWVGNRDKLLTDILTSLASATLRDISRSVESSGAARVVQSAELYTQTLIASDYYRAFLNRDPERALRLISTKASPLQRQIVTYFEQILNEEEQAGRFAHPLPKHDLAYLIVRVLESFLYSDLITGEDPDAEKARTAVEALLGYSTIGESGEGRTTGMASPA